MKQIDENQICSILASLKEDLAALEHERWSHWQRYMHNNCEPQNDGSLLVPADLVALWSRQMSTSYAELSDDEKDSDRKQVDRYLPLIELALTK